MDKPSHVNLSSTDASVSNIPTATPIVSEIISDFEPDPKFEITPLEKATFDCNDLLLQDNNLSELVQHSENGDQQGENGANKLEKRQVSQDSAVHNEPNEGENKAAATFPEVDTNSEPKPKDSQITSCHIRGDSELLTPSSNDIPKINDCPSSSDKNEIDADHLTATISLDESIAATALVEVAERADALVSHNMKESDQNRQQYSAITTSQQTGQVQTNEGNDTANYLFSNSQTSVDALRDKVIESALELGEAHDFSHAPIQVEDREKLFESIHREVTSIQSSIDLIADVASQQQSIEINPVEPQKQVQQHVGAESSLGRSIPRQDIDLITEGQLSSLSKKDAQSSKPQPSKNSDKHEIFEETSSLKEPETVVPEKTEEVEASKPTVEIVCETIHASEVDEGLSEIPATHFEPIIEEPPASSEILFSEVHEERKLGSEKTKEGLADILVEPLESAHEAAEQLNLYPVVEEASSADEQEQSDNITEAKQADQVGATAQLVSEEPTEIGDTAEIDEPTAVKKTMEEKRVDSSKNEADTVEATSNEETGRRKSGRKIRAPKLIDEQPKIEEPRRGSSRVSSRKRQEKADRPIETTEPVQQDHQTSEPEKTDHIAEAKEEYESKEEETAQNQNEDHEQQEKHEDQQIEPMKVDQTKEEADEEANLADQTESEPVEEHVGRPSRSLRTRAPKRKLEEEIPESEPPKKQVKRSRLSDDQLNKSTAPPRRTSIIKLPALKSRMTISTSDPSSRPGAHRERATIASTTSDKKYVCKECGFGTDRLDNIVYHNTKSFCQGKSDMAEMMKNDIIKQQQSKGRRKQHR